MSTLSIEQTMLEEDWEVGEENADSQNLSALIIWSYNVLYGLVISRYRSSLPMSPPHLPPNLSSSVVCFMASAL